MRDGRRFARLSLVLGILILLAGIYYEPWIYIWSAPVFVEKTGDGPQELTDRLVSCGNRAIRPMISAIRNQSPWVRMTAGFPHGLARLGEPAHKALREAVVEETEPIKRAFLVYSLQEAFGDRDLSSPVEEDLKQGRLGKWAEMHWKKQQARPR